MNASSIIAKKRDKMSLTEEEITFFVNGYTGGEIPDYQMAALLMAIYLNDLSMDEIVYLTKAMKDSGDIIDLSNIKGMKVDKHSTGGIGDKTTLIVAPIAAAAGVNVAKMSGRSLGFTGGTADKLEAIPNFKNSFTVKELEEQVNKIGVALITQTANIAPADKKIYALRDVTQTVANMGLIASSIMSKKLASGDDAIVLDVKCGAGAFMKDIASAVKLSEIMVSIGNSFGKKTVAIISDMDKPLGKAVGNSLEVIEAIELLKGSAVDDLKEICIELSAMMIFLAKKADSIYAAKNLANKLLDSGKAFEKFKEIVKLQGGDMRIFENYDVFPTASMKKELIAEEKGYVCAINAQKVGTASQLSGAGRLKKDDKIDLSSGIYLNVQIGSKVAKGDVIATIYGNDAHKLKDAYDEISGAFFIGDKKPEKLPIIKKIVGLD
ncbi:MAG: thymidine phosphorylase [Eubacteriales bacterium]